MDTRILLAITGPLSAIAGGALTAIVMLKTEDRRQKGEQERQKLAWKREQRLKRLEPIRTFLGKVVAIVHEYGQAKTRMDVLQADQKSFYDLECSLRLRLDQTVSKEGGIVETIWDEELRLLLVDITFAAGMPDWRITNKDYKQMIQRAYKKLEELEAEF